MEPRRYLLLARRWGWLLVSTTLAAALVALLVSHAQPKVYASTATVMVNEPQDVGGGTDVWASQNIAHSLASVVTSQPVLTAAASSLGDDRLAASSECGCLRIGRQTVLQVSALVPSSTQLINIRAEASSPDLAGQGANAVAQAFIDNIKQSRLSDTNASLQEMNRQLQSVQATIQKMYGDYQALGRQGSTTSGPGGDATALLPQLSQQQTTIAALESQIAQLSTAQASLSSSVKVVSPGMSPASPSSPQTLVNTVIGGLFGLLVGAGAAFLLETLDDRVRDPHDLKKVAALDGVPILGIIAHFKPADVTSGELERGFLLPVGPRPSFALELYRKLRANLEFAISGHQIKTIAVTSGQQGEDKTTTAVNLAIVLAESGKRVLLVDVDLRRPSIDHALDISNHAGLSTLFLPDHPSLDAVVHETEHDRLRVLTSGPVPPNPTELLGSPRMTEILTLAAQNVDLVVLDGPPVLAFADMAEIAARVDGVILTVDTNKTRAAQLVDSRAVLDGASARLLGLVLNEVPRGRLKDSARFSYYSYTPAVSIAPDRTAETEPGNTPGADRRELVGPRIRGEGLPRDAK